MKRMNTVALALMFFGATPITAAQEPQASQEPLPAAPLDPAEAEAPAETAPADAGSGSRLIEEIIVTAQRREENIKDVPISISAYSPDFLEAKGVVAQQDLPKVTPGLTISNPVGFSVAFIRGVGSDAFILADPLVVTYIDGVYFPASTTQFQEFGDLEQIEVAKGPQGTLFGRNALGGVIAIKSRNPSLTDVQGSLKTTYTAYTGTKASRHAWTSSGFLSVPLTETLAFSVSGLVGYNDPYYNQRYGPSNNRRLVEDGDSYAYRIKALWQPLDDLEVKLNAYRSYTNDPQRNFGVQTNPSALGGSAADNADLFLQPQDPFEGGELNDTPYSYDRTLNYFGSVDWNLPWLKVQLLAAKQNIEAVRNADFDGTPQPVAYFEDVDRRGDSYSKPFFSDGKSLEMRFLSNDSAPDWLELVGGIYLYKQESGVGGANFYAFGTQLAEGTIGGTEIPGLAALYADVLAPLGVAPVGLNLALRGGLKEDAQSVYGQGTLKFTDWVSLTLGARYQVTDRDVLFADQLFYVNEQTQIPIQQNSGKDNPMFRSKTKDFDPKIVLSFKPGTSFLGDDPLLYLSYQTASIASTFNTISLFQAPTFTKGSTLTAYEAGIKTFLFGGRTNFDAAVFYYEQKDPQTQVVSLQTGGAVRFENAGGIETYGAEFGVVSPIFAELTNDGLVFTLGFSYLDSTYSSYPNASGFDEDTGQYSQDNDFSGNRVIQTPKYTVSTGLNQTFQFGNSTLDVGVDYYYNDGFFFLAQNSENSEVESYQTVGVTASYLYSPWDLRLSLFGRNILDEEYLGGRFVNDFGVVDYPAPKSTAGATLKWQF